MRRRLRGGEGRRKLRERRPAIAARVIKALLTLPGFEPAGRQAARNSQTGETIVPVESTGELNREDGAVIVVAADGSTDSLPAHHYLVDQLVRVREAEARPSDHKGGAVSDDRLQVVEDDDNSRKGVAEELE